MVEICFSPSLQGALRYARYQYDRENVGKKRVEMIRLPNHLSLGDISDPLAPNRDQESPIEPNFLSFCFLSETQLDDWNDEDDNEKDDYQRRAERLQTIKKWNVTIRIWVDDRPDSLCGLLFAASILAGGKCKVMVNKLPARLPSGKLVKDWICADTEEVYSFMKNGEYICARELEVLAKRWKALQRENKTLRVTDRRCVGGVASKDENWYDKIIAESIPQQPFLVHIVVGSILASGQVPTECTFPALRLWRWVQAGKLTVVEKGTGGFFSWKLKKSDEWL